MSARLVLKLILLRPRVASFEAEGKTKEPTGIILNTSVSANVAFRFLFPRESKIHRLFAYPSVSRLLANSSRIYRGHFFGNVFVSASTIFIGGGKKSLHTNKFVRR